jgi:ketosteroid isomerase-like protein
VLHPPAMARPAASIAVVATAAVALALGCMGGGGADHPLVEPVVTPATPKEVISAARGILEQWRQAQEVKSFETLSALYTHDNDVVVVSEGVALIGWSSVSAMLQDRLATATAIHVRLKDVQVASLSPNVASALATMTREVQSGATTVSEAGTLTLVLRHADTAGAPWLIVAEHYSYKAH